MRSILRLTASLRNLSQISLRSFAERLTIGAEVTLKLDNTDSPENKIVDVRIMLKGNDLYSSKECKTFEEALDKSVDALKNQVEKHKNKHDK